MNTSCEKCQKPTNINLKYRIDGINILNVLMLDLK